MPDTPDDWKLDPYPEDLPSPTDFLDHEPGAPHQYEIICKVCGVRGMVRLSIDPQYEGSVSLDELKKGLDADRREPHDA
jgi:hypothetical protein